MINGIDAATYVADWAYTASFNQDADAAYNSMFYEKAFVASGTSSGYFGAGGRMRYVGDVQSPLYFNLAPRLKALPHLKVPPHINFFPHIKHHALISRSDHLS